MHERKIAGMLRDGDGAVKDTRCAVVNSRAGECESCEGRGRSCKWLADSVENLGRKRRERHVGKRVPENRTMDI